MYFYKGENELQKYKCIFTKEQMKGKSINTFLEGLNEAQSITYTFSEGAKKQMWK